MRHVSYWIVKRGRCKTRFDSYINAREYHLNVLGSCMYPVYVDFNAYVSDVVKHGNPVTLSGMGFKAMKEGK